MDSINKFKKIWEQSVNENQKPFDKKELEIILRNQSADPVEKLKRSLSIEIFSLLLALPILVFIFIQIKDIYFMLNTGVLILLFFLSLIYYYFNYRSIVKIWRTKQDNILNSIQSTLLLVKFFRKTYFRLNLILFPFALYFGYVMGFALGSDGEKIHDYILFEQISPVFNILIILVILGVLFFLFYLFLRWYMKKLYDVHIKNLEQVLDELNENRQDI
ncbi:MAG: hypothetical protein ACOCYO_10975 [Bacteroidota bacterium]